MAIIEMSKITLVGLQKDKEYILKRLMELGVVHVIDPGIDDPESVLQGYAYRDSNNSEVQALEKDIEMISFSLKFLSQFDKRKKSLFPTRIEINKTDYENIPKTADEVFGIARKLEEIQNRIQLLTTKSNAVKNSMDSLIPWRNLDVPLELKRTRRTQILKGKLPASNEINRIKAELYAGVPQSYLEIVNEDKEQAYLLLTVHEEYVEHTLQILKKYGFVSEEFGGMKGTAAENLARLKAELERIEKEREELHNEAAGFSDSITRLEMLYDYLNILKGKAEAVSSLASTGRVFILKGWVPEKISDKVAEIVTSEKDCFVELQKPSEDEEYPILLKNNDVAQSVEIITEMYSLPSSTEVDPNAVMAPFFILFFGLMLSDAGYGAVMAIGTAFILRKFDLKARTRNFLKLLFYCGLATVFWGALFGGWFGDVVNVLTGGRVSLPPLWFNPIDDPERLLMWSLLFGVIHIYVGISVRAYNLIRKRQYLDAIFDSLFWYILFTGTVFAVLPYVPNVDKEWAAGFVAAGTKMIIVGAVLLVLTQGRKQKNVIAKLFSGIGSLYDLVGFISDVLSYSRLLAMGLATGVIATIINQMGTMAGTDNIFGLVVFAIVFIVGHIFNFLINALGAYVHSSRLQYIEFFGKFYEGGGKAFDPLRLNTRYIKIKSDEEDVLNGKHI